MNNNSLQIYNVLKVLYEKMLKQDYVTDKSGVKLLQIVDAKYIINPIEKFT